MKKYKVIKSFIIPGMGRVEEGDCPPLPTLDMYRLIQSGCVVEVEDRMATPPENRIDTQPRKRSNRRARLIK